MHIVPLDDYDDERLAPYRNLKTTNLTRWSGLFIAEGLLVVQRLLRSPLHTHSILIREDRVNTLLNEPIPESVPIYTLPYDQAQRLVGFNFHMGIVACGRRPAPVSLDQFLATTPKRSLLVACERMTDPHNLGGMIRICRAFGANGLILSKGCADPYSRRTVRVSMGNLFQLPIIEAADLQIDLPTCQQAGFEVLGAILDDTAQPLSKFQRKDRSLILFGNETDGLESTTANLCDTKLIVPMHDGTDSLNVTVAAGIFLHHLSQGHPSA